MYGHVSGYLGVVEPQMRKALHIHMLIQLLGFAHPADLFSDGRFADTFRRLWYFATSICFRSTEAFAAYTREDRAMETLQQEPLLPLAKKQRGMIGEARARESVSAQLAARGLSSTPVLSHPHRSPTFYVPQAYGESRLDSGEWASLATREICIATS